MRYNNAWKFRILAGMFDAGLFELDVWTCRIIAKLITNEDLYTLLTKLFPTKEFMLDGGVRVEEDLFDEILAFVCEPEETREAL